MNDQKLKARQKILKSLGWSVAGAVFTALIALSLFGLPYGYRGRPFLHVFGVVSVLLVSLVNAMISNIQFAVENWRTPLAWIVVIVLIAASTLPWITWSQLLPWVEKTQGLVFLP